MRVSKLGRRRSTKKVGDRDEAQNLARGMRSATQNVNQKKKENRKVFSQRRNLEKNTAYVLIVQQMQIIYTEWITADGLCVYR